VLTWSRWSALTTELSAETRHTSRRILSFNTTFTPSLSFPPSYALRVSVTEQRLVKLTLTASSKHTSTHCKKGDIETFQRELS